MHPSGAIRGSQVLPGEGCSRKGPLHFRTVFRGGAARMDVQAEIDVGPGAIRSSSAPANAEPVSSPAATTKRRHPQGGH